MVDKLQVIVKLFWKKLIKNLNCREGMDFHFRITLSVFWHWGEKRPLNLYIWGQNLCFSCATNSWLLNLDAEQLFPVLQFRQQERRKKDIHLCHSVCSPSWSMNTAAPKRKEETNSRTLKCSLCSVIYIVCFHIQGKIGQ